MPDTSQEVIEVKNSDKFVHDSVQVLLQAQFTLLGQKLLAAYKKEDRGYKVLLAPTNFEKNNGVTIEEMVKQVNGLLGNIDSSMENAIDQEDLENQIKSANEGDGSSFDFTKLRFILQTAYLYINKEDGKTSTEYAFDLMIDASNVFPKDFIVKVESVSISVWNTKREKVVNTMSLFDPKAYIEG